MLLKCRGALNVQLRHENTIEFSPDPRVTVRGDCVACIQAQLHAIGRCRRGEVEVSIIAVPPYWYRRPPLEYSIKCQRICNERGYILRRSEHCDKRTLAVGCEAAARELGDMSLRRLASNPYTWLYVIVRC